MCMMLFVFVMSVGLPLCGDDAVVNKTVDGSTRGSLGPLPLSLLSGLGGPLGGSGGSSLGGSGPVLTSTIPATASSRGTSEARGGGVPVAAGGLGKASLDGSGTLLLNARELLLLDLLLGLGLRVAVCNWWSVLI